MKNRWRSEGSKVKYVIMSTLLGTLSILVATLLIETGLRIWTPQSLAYKSVRQTDPELNHSLRPSSHFLDDREEFSVEVRTNSLGLRDHEVLPEDSSLTRIVVLGDSFTEGYGVDVDSCFVKRLERRLNNSSDPRFRVYNCGISGFSPLLEYLLLRKKAIALRPDLIIMEFDMSDVMDDHALTKIAEFDREGVPARVRPSAPELGSVHWFPDGAFKNFIYHHSYIYSLAIPLLTALKPRPPATQGDPNGGIYVTSLESTDVQAPTLFDLSESYILLTKEVCDRLGIPFLLSVHPRGHQVHSVEWKQGREYWGFERRVYDSAIFRSLERFATRSAIPFLNMTASFRRRSTGGNLYLANDGHWTNAGHQVAADTLYEYLMQSRLLHSKQGTKSLDE